MCAGSPGDISANHGAEDVRSSHHSERACLVCTGFKMKSRIRSAHRGDETAELREWGGRKVDSDL